MILKAFNIPQKDYKDEEDFFLNCEAFIGPEDESYVYEVYSIYVISLNRLCESFADNGIMLNKGWINVFKTQLIFYYARHLICKGSGKYYNADGSPIWSRNRGFDGEPVTTTLKPGAMVDRYGYDGGYFVSTKGTSYTESALPVGTDKNHIRYLK